VIWDLNQGLKQVFRKIKDLSKRKLITRKEINKNKKAQIDLL
jgi:hypothetical protein